MRLLLLLSLLLASSCFKTAEEIRRENMVDTMSAQLEQSSKLVAELTQQVNDLQARLASTTGQIQEMGHQQKEYTEQQKLTMEQAISQLTSQVKVLTDENKANRELIEKLDREVSEQKTFIKKITATLSKMGGGSSGRSSKRSGSTLKQAHSAFEKGKNKEAKELYLEVLAENKINAAQKNGVYYNLGLLEYRSKSYDQALVYFSKIYTKYPRSSYAGRSLLYIARAFDKQGKKDEAKEAYSEVVKNYPGTPQAKDAKEEMK